MAIVLILAVTIGTGTVAYVLGLPGTADNRKNLTRA